MSSEMCAKMTGIELSQLLPTSDASQAESPVTLLAQFLHFVKRIEEWVGRGVVWNPEQC